MSARVASANLMLRVQTIKPCNCDYCKPVSIKYAALVALTLGGFWLYRKFKLESK